MRLETNRPPSHLVNQIFVVRRLHISPIFVKAAKIVRNISPISLPHVKSVSHESKPILIPILHIKIFKARSIKQVQEMQSRARIDSRLAVPLPLLEPRSACRRPGCTLQEEICMLSELE